MSELRVSPAELLAPTSEVVYTHYRAVEGLPDKVLFSTTQLREAGRQPQPRSGATCARVTVGTREFSAWAFCSPHDNYCKAIGRAIARGRLLKRMASEDARV